MRRAAERTGAGKIDGGGRVSGFCVIVASLALLASLAPCSTLSAEEFKIGSVDLATVFDNYERTRQSEAVLERKGKQKESELEQRLSELQNMRQGLELLNEESRESKTRQLQEKADELRRFQLFTKRDLAGERDRIASEILEDIEQVVSAYGKANGFTIIMDRRSLLFGQDGLDVTREILTQLNRQYSAARR